MEKLDVAILGGGPAGSGIASYLAQAGVSCAIFEKEIFPRPHVGESLVPSSTRVFNEIGFIEDMEHSGFPRKYGAAWTTARGQALGHDFEGLEPDEYVDFRFSEREQQGVNRPYTWHVDRGRFDLMLLQHAAKSGAGVYSGVTVKDVEFNNGDGAKVGVSMAGRTIKVPAKLVVDATGRKTLLGTRMGLRVRDPVFDQYAVHTWFGDLDRLSITGAAERSDYIFIHFLPINDSWIWQIPISDSVTSVGVVTQKKNFAKSRQDREKFFWSCLESRPDLASPLREAQQLRPLKEEGDYSYAMSNIAGDGFVLIGDAARFVDPIFSTGVSIALNSARFASRDILAALESGNTKKSAFDTYEKTLQRGTKNWYDFISVYYRLNLLFTAFVRNPKYRLDVLKLLQGDVYDDDRPAVLEEMKRIIKAVESRPDHIWHKSLGSLTAESLRSAL